MTTSRDLAHAARAVAADLLDAETDEDCVEALAAADALAPALADKLHRNAHVLRAIHTRQQHHQAEADYYLGLAAGHQAEVRRARAREGWLRALTLTLELSRREMTGDSQPFRLDYGGSLSVSRRTSYVVEDADVRKLPAECIRMSPDKAAIVRLTKAGADVPGATVRADERVSLLFRQPREAPAQMSAAEEAEHAMRRG